MIDEFPVSRTRICTGTSSRRSPWRERRTIDLDLRVVVRVLRREEAQRLPVDPPETRCRVAHALAHHQRDDRSEEVGFRRGEAACPGSRRPDEARADDEVGPSVEDRLQRPADLARVMLSVAVDLNRQLKAVLERVLVPRLHGAADANVEGEVQDGGTTPCGNSRSSVLGGVVHDHNVQINVRGADLLQHGADRVLLVVGRHDRERPKPLPRDGRRALQGLGAGCHLRR